MKRLLAVFLILVFGLASVASAQHRGGWQHQRYDGGHHGYYGGRHGGVTFGQAIAGAVVLTGVAVVANSILRPQPVVVVEETFQQPQQCQLVWQRVVDTRGRPLYDQYTGQPLLRQVQICQASVAVPMTVTQ